MNYYDYTDDAGVIWAILLQGFTAAFVTAVPCSVQRPKLPGGKRIRRLRLADTTSGSERLVIAPYAWPYNLGDVVTYEGNAYYVTFQLEEQAVLEKP